jgi:elongator complex protein 4
MRKRFVFETLHLDLEGGVGERRTAPSKSAAALDEATMQHHAPHTTTIGGDATVQVALEGKPFPELSAEASAINDEGSQASLATGPPKKAKKKVAFHSDRPELYDF